MAIQAGAGPGGSGGAGVKARTGVTKERAETVLGGPGDGFRN